MPMDLATFRAILSETGAINIEFRPRQEDDWPVTLDYWFGSDKWRATGHTFDLLGVDGTGGLYCLWRCPGASEQDSPAVFLGSEGEGVGVVAADLSEFAGIVARGYWWFGSTGSWSRDNDNIIEVALRDFEAAVRERIPVSDVEPDRLVEAARARHPDFKAWADAQVS